MRIKTIRLNEYKRFFNLTIDLGNDPARIIALVGPNGCGKSSVFDGMLFLMNAYGMIAGYIDSSMGVYSELEAVIFNRA